MMTKGVLDDDATGLVDSPSVSRRDASDVGLGLKCKTSPFEALVFRFPRTVDWQASPMLICELKRRTGQEVKCCKEEGRWTTHVLAVQKDFRDAL